MAAVRTSEKNGKNGLGHVDETRDVGREHDVDILLLYLRGFRNTLDQAAFERTINQSPFFLRKVCKAPGEQQNSRVVHKDMDIPPFLR